MLCLPPIARPHPSNALQVTSGPSTVAAALDKSTPPSRLALCKSARFGAALQGPSGSYELVYRSTSLAQPGTRWLAAESGTQGGPLPLRHSPRAAPVTKGPELRGAAAGRCSELPGSYRAQESQQGAVAVATQQHPVAAGSAGSGSSADGTGSQGSEWIIGGRRRHHHAGHAAASGWNVSGHHLAALHGRMCFTAGDACCWLWGRVQPLASDLGAAHMSLKPNPLPLCRFCCVLQLHRLPARRPHRRPAPRRHAGAGGGASGRQQSDRLAGDEHGTADGRGSHHPQPRLLCCPAAQPAGYD